MTPEAEMDIIQRVARSRHDRFLERFNIPKRMLYSTRDRTIRVQLRKVMIQSYDNCWAINDYIRWIAYYEPAQLQRHHVTCVGRGEWGEKINCTLDRLS